MIIMTAMMTTTRLTRALFTQTNHSLFHSVPMPWPLFWLHWRKGEAYRIAIRNWHVFFRILWVGMQWHCCWCVFPRWIRCTKRLCRVYSMDQPQGESRAKWRAIWYVVNKNKECQELLGDWEYLEFVWFNVVWREEFSLFYFILFGKRNQRLV